jgi:hypothetical protein
MSQFPPTRGPLPYANFLPPPKYRPTSVTAIGIIAIVFGSISLLVSLCSLGTMTMRRSGAGNSFLNTTSSSTVTPTGPSGTTTTTTANGPNGTMTFNYHTSARSTFRDPTTTAFNVITLPIKIVLAIVEIWAGASLLGLKPAARQWIIRFAVADIIFTTATILFSILVIQPQIVAAIQRSMQQSSSNPLQPQMAQFMQIGVYVADVFYLALLIWPTVILFCMTRPHVKAAFLDGPNSGQ